MKKQKLHYAWIILIAVILIRGFAGGGLNMTAPLFLSYVASDLQVGIGNLSIYFSISLIVLVIWLPFAGKLMNRYDVRIMALIGVLLQTVSFIGFAFMNHVYGWYVLAIPYAMGAAILINLLGPILINRWFSTNTGLMMGIQMAFVGLFGAVLQPIASILIVNEGWRDAYITMGMMALIMIVLTALFLLKNKPQDTGVLPYGEEEAKENMTKNMISEAFHISEKTAVQSASFYLLLMFMIAITGIGVFTQHIPTYGAILGYSASAIGTVLALSSIGNAIGSIVIGLITDKIGVLKTCYGMLGIGFLAVSGFFLSQNSLFLFGISTFLHGLTSAGIMVLTPILTLQFYGKQDYEPIYAKISMGAPLASILLVPAYGFIYDITNSYVFVLLGMYGLIFAAFVCIVLGWKKRCTLNGCPGWKRNKF